VDPKTKISSCGRNFARLTGVTQSGPPEGMKYDSIARLLTETNHVACNNATGVLTIPSISKSKALAIVIGAGTNYDRTHGTQEYNFSFKGVDPGSYVEAVTLNASSKPEEALRSAHVADYSTLANQFNISLPDTTHSAGLETSIILKAYNQDGKSNPYLEATLFDLGRHLFISSSRSNSLPPNLQGKWATDLSNAWSGDYHGDINLQMNHWGVSETGLDSLQEPLWNYMTDTWVPRGQQTAQILYGSKSVSGAWVTHDESNIFGHTGMKGLGDGDDAYQWADYPATAAWMMQHVYDHWEYSQDVQWLEVQGYPLLKGVAEFWLGQLQKDSFFNDSSLVVNPCNSPEHGPATFSCSHYQQLIHQVFVAILNTSPYVSNIDSLFVSQVKAVLPSLDKGLHIGDWGEIKEWKIPDSYGYDFKNDTHRHLSM
jgi:alpha-L-fucosidase 2